MGEGFANDFLSSFDLAQGGITYAYPCASVVPVTPPKASILKENFVFSSQENPSEFDRIVTFA
jgi:hypothetical protein